MSRRRSVFEPGVTPFSIATIPPYGLAHVVRREAHKRHRHHAAEDDGNAGNAEQRVDVVRTGYGGGHQEGQAKHGSERGSAGSLGKGAVCRRVDVGRQFANLRPSASPEAPVAKEVCKCCAAA
jgi:hypothetical protein